MNSRNNSYRGFGFYLVLILIVVGVWYFLDGNTTTNSYTRAAFEKDGIPANVFLMECRGKYIVYTGDEFDGSECCSLGLQFIEYGLFETYEAADEYYKTLINAGIPSGKEQIKKCKEDLTESEDISLSYIPERDLM